MTNVLIHTRSKQHRFLTYQSYAGAQKLDVKRPDIMVIKKDASLHWIIKPFEELEDCGLSGTRRTDNGREFSNWDIEIDVLQNDH